MQVILLLPLAGCAAFRSHAPGGRPAHTLLRRTTTATCQEQPVEWQLPSVEVSDVLAQQAAEIAALRGMVENMQRDRDDQQAALGVPEERMPETPRATRPPKRDEPSKVVYRRQGVMPPGGFDGAPVERLIARRVTARLKKHYSEADRLQKRILRMGVQLDDKRRTWSLLPGWQQLQDSLQIDDEDSNRKRQLLEHELEDRIRFLFRYWDGDGNGLIDRSEFRLVMQVLAIPGTKDEYDAYFDEWDGECGLRSGKCGLNFKEIREALLGLQKSHPHVLDAAHRTASLLGGDHSDSPVGPTLSIPKGA